MNVGDHHLVVESSGPELVLTTAPRGFIFGDKAVRKEECERRSADIVDILSLGNFGWFQETRIEETLKSAIIAVGVVGERTSA